MERAIAITARGHDAAARATIVGVSERDVQTQLEYAFFANGATGLSYSSIVGSGPNGAVLHWDKNSRILQNGDLVVVDAAADYGRYASDVTRTYPASGHFTAEQARVYRAVYQAQEDIFAAIKPGVSMADLQHVAEESLRKAGYLADFIHGFGHFVGLEADGPDEVRRATGMTVLVTTHYMDEADQQCDRIALMHRGRIRAQGTPAELKAMVGEHATLDDVFRATTGDDLGTNSGEGMRDVRSA